jgi:hypothetical protein
MFLFRTLFVYLFCFVCAIAFFLLDISNIPFNIGGVSYDVSAGYILGISFTFLCLSTFLMQMRKRRSIIVVAPDFVLKSDNRRMPQKAEHIHYHDITDIVIYTGKEANKNVQIVAALTNVPTSVASVSISCLDIYSVGGQVLSVENR